MTCSGSGSAAESTSSAATTSSISPVGKVGLTVSGLRATTRPVTVITLSTRTASAAANGGVPGLADQLHDPGMVAQVDEE